MKKIFAKLLSVFLFGALSFLPIMVYAGNPDQVSGDKKSVVSADADVKKSKNLELTDSEIEAGLKAILREGVAKAVAKLAVSGGFNDNGAAKIELPRSMRNVKKVLDDIEQVELVRTYIDRLNKSAEKSSPKVGGYFIVAIDQFKIKEPSEILKAGGAPASKYLKKRMFYGLSKVIRPIIRKEMKLNGAYRGYDEMISVYRRVPYQPNVRGGVEDYMVDNILNAFFSYLEEYERSIWTNPDTVTDEAIKKLFL